jgi:hypothetical protein
VKYKTRESAAAAMEKLTQKEMKDYPGNKVCCLDKIVYRVVEIHLFSGLEVSTCYCKGMLSDT